jgi:hypothetical protein
VSKGKWILTARIKEDLTARGFSIVRECLQPGGETPFPGRTSWIKAYRSAAADPPAYFACGYIAEQSVYYFEDEETRSESAE